MGGAGRDLIYWHTYDVGLPLVQAYSNDARSDYHALLVEYVRRRSRGFQGSVSYTLSHALDNDSGEARRGYAPPQLISPSLNWGSADFDRRHVLRMVGSYQVPALRAPEWLQRVCENWQVDAVLTAQTGTPVSVFYPRPSTSEPISLDQTRLTTRQRGLLTLRAQEGGTSTRMHLSYRPRRVQELSDATHSERFHYARWMFLSRDRFVSVNDWSRNCDSMRSMCSTHRISARRTAPSGRTTSVCRTGPMQSRWAQARFKSEA